MAAGLNREWLAAQGVWLLKPDRALRALGTVIEEGTELAFVADMDWEAFSGNLGLDRAAGIFSGLAATAAKAAPTVVVKAQEKSIAEEVRSVLPMERRALVRKRLQELARRVLGCGDSEPVAWDQPLVDQGFDSLTAVDMRNQLGKNLGCTLPASLLFDHPTLDRIADYLIKDILKFDAGSAPDAATDSLLDDIDKLVLSI
jgi:acyl carrier protein